MGWPLVGNRSIPSRSGAQKSSRYFCSSPGGRPEPGPAVQGYVGGSAGSQGGGEVVLGGREATEMNLEEHSSCVQAVLYQHVVARWQLDYS